LVYFRDLPIEEQRNTPGEYLSNIIFYQGEINYGKMAPAARLGTAD
jgi:hypothetical protein